MESQLKTLDLRNLIAIAAMICVMIAFQGCGGNDENDDQDNDAGAVQEAGAQKYDQPSSPGALYEDDDDGGDEHGEAGHEGTEAEFTEPQNYAQAIHVIHEQLEKIESLMESGTLDRVHAEAAVIRDIAGSLAKFALLEDSGVGREAVREINLAAKDLAATWAAIDEAGDAGDLAGTRKVYDEMVALFEVLEKHAGHDDDDDDDHEDDDDGDDDGDDDDEGKDR